MFYRSTTASSILHRTLEQLEISPLKPLLDVPTRWNSAYDMLDRYIRIRPGICAALNHFDLRNSVQKDTLPQQDVADIEAVRVN